MPYEVEERETCIQDYYSTSLVEGLLSTLVKCLVTSLQTPVSFIVSASLHNLAIPFFLISIRS